MAENDGEKSQEATSHRRQQAREEGQVAKSQDLASAALLLLALISLLTLGGDLIDAIAHYFTRQLGGTAWLSADPAFAVAEWQQTVSTLGRYLLPIFAVIVVTGVVANLLQVGFLFLPDKLMPDITRLDPLQGMTRIFSLSNVMKLVFGLIKMSIIGIVAYTCVSNERDKILGLTTMAVPQIALYTVELLLWTGIKIASALVLLAVLDYGFQKWKFEKDIRMTTEELREEMKNLEGNPQVLAKRRQLQRQMATHRLGEAVPKADVIVTNPTHLAVAIQYDPESMAAPIVVAKGAGLIAERIKQLGQMHNIPILEKKPLARALYRDVAVNHPIPHDNYAAVAEVLAYVYQLKGKKMPKPRGK